MLYRARAALIGTAYNVLFPFAPAALDKINNHELEKAYKAAQLAAFYTITPEHVRDMSLYLAELERRNLATASQYEDMYEAFVKARMLDEARELARRHPSSELEVLPDVREASNLVPDQPTEWVVDPDRRELLRRNVDLRRSAHIVIVSHPKCHFSSAAAQDLQADPVLSKIFATHAKWLAPQAARIEFDDIQRSNRQHPEQETTLAFRREEWPMIDSWGTPTFYFLRDGAVAAKVVGWPKEGRRFEVLAGLRVIGLHTE